MKKHGDILINDSDKPDDHCPRCGNRHAERRFTRYGPGRLCGACCQKRNPASFETMTPEFDAIDKIAKAKSDAIFGNDGHLTTHYRKLVALNTSPANSL